jgi:hypothetical protein
MRVTTLKSPTPPAYPAGKTADDYLEVAIPFQGFYESIHCDECGQPRDFLEYARAYAAQWAHEARIQPQNQRASQPLDLHFVELVRPSEYNFTTDAIYCHISKIDINAIFTLLKATPEGLALLAQKARENLPTEGEGWGNDPTAWPTARLSLLLDVWAEHIQGTTTTIEEDIAEMLRGNGYYRHAWEEEGIL